MLIAFASLLWTHAYGGELDNFEKGTRGKRTRKVGSSTTSPSDEILESCLVDLVGECLMIPFAAGLTEGTANSVLLWDEREPGWPIIPIVRVDAAYHNVTDADVHALDHSFEIGWGPVALELNHTHYWEEEPADDLNIFQAALLCRMAASPNFEIDVAIGDMYMQGDSSTNGFLIGFPVRWWLSDNVGVEGRLMWASLSGGSITDHRIGGVLRYKLISLIAGYRRRESGDASLNGPYVGLSFRY